MVLKQLKSCYDNVQAGDSLEFTLNGDDYCIEFVTEFRLEIEYENKPPEDWIPF